MKVDVHKLKSDLDRAINDQLMSPKFLLSSCRLIEESSRLSSAYTDPRYLPFYYHLGKLVSPVNVVEFGFRLGLAGSCFLRSCGSVQKYLAVQEPDKGQFYSPRLGRANVKDRYKKELNVHHGLISDNNFLNNIGLVRWDLALICDEVGYDRNMSYLDLLWGRLASGGLIVMDHLSKHEPARKSFSDFALANNREPVFIKTRYGVGIIQR